MKPGTKETIKEILGTTRRQFEAQLAGLGKGEIDAIRDFFGGAAENPYQGGEKTPKELLWMLIARYYSGDIELGKS